MAREDDVLFCKIAITNGMVTQEQAQKCLNFCERREQEGKRRPLVGAVFTKYNLLRPEQVQQLYSAVNKRLGRAAGPAQVLAGGGDRKRAKGRNKAKAARRQPAKKVDPNTLWKGIGGGGVLIIAVVIMIVMYIQGGSSRVEEEAEQKGGTPGAGASSTLPGSTPSGSVSPEGGSPGAALPAQETPVEVDQGFRSDHLRMVGEARRTANIDERFQDALGVLAMLKEQHAQFYKLYPDYLQEVEVLEKDIKAMMGTGESSPESGGELEAPTLDDM